MQSHKMCKQEMDSVENEMRELKKRMKVLQEDAGVESSAELVPRRVLRLSNQALVVAEIRVEASYEKWAVTFCLVKVA